MSRQKRLELIQKIERLRNSKVICYLTSLRPNVPGQIAGDQVPIFFKHLSRLDKRPVEKLDIFLCSNGGDGTVPWRLTALFREFSKSFDVLIPYRAYSAASLLALGADEIVMHPFGEMGPIDPTVTNEFNPSNPITNRQIGISVEDVKAYISFIKETVGITHEDELVRTIEILANKVHPLALGNVERFISQSRMIARKILKNRKNNVDDHVIEEIVENMASRLYFHGHPINRKEAKNELKLHVNDELGPDIESALWDLYELYDAEFENKKEFRPADPLLKQRYQVYKAGGQIPLPATYDSTETLLHCMIESEALCSKHTTTREYYLTDLGPDQEPQIREIVTGQGWDHQ